MKTHLVTGGAGFIASSFVRLMLKSGASVIVLDKLTYAGHRENLAECFFLAKRAGVNFELHVGDICDSALVAELLETHTPISVVNFAAESHVDNSISRPKDFIETNIGGTFNLLHESLKYFEKLPLETRSDFRFIQVSTDEVYGSLGPTGKFSENSQYAPNSPYSASKAAGDMLARAWFHTYGLPVITTNCSNNYGPRQFPEKLIPVMINAALAGKVLPVYGDGGNIRDWIHVEDHCAGIVKAIDLGVPGETYCFGGNAERNNLEVVREICAALDEFAPRNDGLKHEVAISFVADRPGHDRRYAIDDSKACSKLNFSRKYDFESGLRATVKWYIDNQDWCLAVKGL